MSKRTKRLIRIIAATLMVIMVMSNLLTVNASWINNYVLWGGIKNDGKFGLSQYDWDYYWREYYIQPTSATSPRYVTDFTAGMNLWNNASAKINFVKGSQYFNSVIDMSAGADINPNHFGWTYYWIDTTGNHNRLNYQNKQATQIWDITDHWIVAEVYINRNVFDSKNLSSVTDYTYLRKIISHEIGHAFGLADDGGDIMTVGSSSNEPSANNVNTVNSRYDSYNKW